MKELVKKRNLSLIVDKLLITFKRFKIIDDFLVSYKQYDLALERLCKTVKDDN